MAKFTQLIPQNIAQKTDKKIAVFDPKGKQVGAFPLFGLKMPETGEKLYSFGALSDVHIVYDTAADDFQKALTYLNDDVDVAFTCICGDLTDDGSADQLSQYKAVVDSYSADTPVYAIAGNHEAYNGKTVTNESIQPYTGHPLYYSFTQGNDVFIMCGFSSYNTENIFGDGELQWLYETLEANRDKRCFVFFHVFFPEDSGNPNNSYPYNIFSGTPKNVFQTLMKHYKNTIFFHGHSHTKFYLQSLDEKANYNEEQKLETVKRKTSDEILIKECIASKASPETKTITLSFESPSIMFETKYNVEQKPIGFYVKFNSGNSLNELTSILIQLYDEENEIWQTLTTDSLGNIISANTNEYYFTNSGQYLVHWGDNFGRRSEGNGIPFVLERDKPEGYLTSNNQILESGYVTYNKDGTINHYFSIFFFMFLCSKK